MKELMDRSLTRLKDVQSVTNAVKKKKDKKEYKYGIWKSFVFEGF